MNNSSAEQVQTAPSVIMPNNKDLQSKPIEQVPATTPVTLPDNPNFQSIPVGSGLALWLWFVLYMWKATPSNIHELTRLLHEFTLFCKMWMSKCQPPRNNKK